LKISLAAEENCMLYSARNDLADGRDSATENRKGVKQRMLNMVRVAKA